MPSYDFLDKNTGEVREYKMSYTVLEQFKADNPHLERFFTAENLPVMSDGSRMSVPGVGQPDATFEREIIGRMKATIPGNTLGKSHKTKMPRMW